MSDKTEEATPRRLRKARQDGDSPVSAFASQSVAFLCAAAVAPAAVSALAGHASTELRTAIANAANPSHALAFDPLSLGLAIVALTSPLLVVVGVASAITSIIQSGGVVATKKLKPTLDRLDIVTGFRQLASAARVVAVARSALFAAAVGWFAYEALRHHAAELARSAGRTPEAAAIAAFIALDVVKRTAILGIFLAILDVVATRRAWRTKLMMSTSDVKREHKESDGDPQLEAARGRARQDMLGTATLANVHGASVVILDPVHLACAALRYDPSEDEEVPIVVASGRGDLAARIAAAARAYGVPIVLEVPLARALIELDEGAAIPETLYEAVAEILREALDETATAASGER